ncbi:ferredoxin [Patescibacteria group bacterium]
MQIEVDKSKCIGSLPCTKIAPTVFKIGDDGKAYILDPKSDTDEHLMNAATTCPTKAITLKDDDGNVIYPTED